MSIRALTSEPCPDCKKDTTHLHHRCRECGHINMTPSQQFTATMNRRAARYRHKYGTVAGANILKAESGHRNAERRNWEKRTGRNDVPSFVAKK